MWYLLLAGKVPHYCKTTEHTEFCSLQVVCFLWPSRICCWEKSFKISSFGSVKPSTILPWLGRRNLWQAEEEKSPELPQLRNLCWPWWFLGDILRRVVVIMVKQIVKNGGSIVKSPFLISPPFGRNIFFKKIPASIANLSLSN